MKPLFQFSIDVDFHASKKNGREIHGRSNRKWIGKSDRLRNAEDYLTLALQSHVNKTGHSPLFGNLHAVFTFFFKDYFTKDGKRSKKLPDLSNLYELPQDCMQKAGVIENDCDICSHDKSRRQPGEKNTLLIEIYPMPEET